jgi:hypothetical protein
MDSNQKIPSDDQSNAPFRKLDDWECALRLTAVFDDELRRTILQTDEGQVKLLAMIAQWPLWRARAAFDCAAVRGMIEQPLSVNCENNG